MYKEALPSKRNWGDTGEIREEGENGANTLSSCMESLNK